jgi:acyl-CoA thioesterase-1
MTMMAVSLISISGPVAGLTAALLTISSCGANSMPTQPSPADSSRLIAVLGDSLSVSPSQEASFPAVLQRRIREEGYDWRVMNFGRNGDVTAQGAARANQVLASGPAILVLELGANDGLRGVPVESVRENLESIITRARDRGARVLLCGMEAPPIRGWRYSLDFHGIYPGLAERYNLPLVPFLLTGVLGNPDMNLENTRGAQRIAETIWPFLEPMLKAVPTSPP